VRSVRPVPLIETARFIVLDQRPGVRRSVRQAVRVALPVAAAASLTYFLPVSAVAHFVLALPGFVAGMVLAAALGAAQANSGVTGLSNVIVIDKAHADSDVVEPDGVRVLSGVTRRDRPFATSLALRLDELAKLPSGLRGPVDPVVSAPMFRWLRRRAPGQVEQSYRIWS
jgi:hypothetical protein